MHSMKKVLVGIIACTIGFSSLNVQAAEISTLTLESAIVRAKTYSKELSEIRRTQTINDAKLTEAAIEGSYKSYQKQYLENQYTEKQEQVQEKWIEYEVAKLFDEILLNESKLKDLEKALKMDQINLESNQLKLQKNIVSQQAYDQLVIDLQTSQNNKEQLKNTIHTQYTTLSEMMGKTTTYFMLQKDPIIYEPFEIAGNLDGVITSKAKQNLTVWKAIESAKINTEIDYASLEQVGNSYVAYLQLKESAVKVQDTSETTLQQFETTLRNKYTELLTLQQQYKLQEQTVELLEKQVITYEKKYELGYVSKNEYEKIQLSYDKAKTSLLEIIVKQEYIKQVIENPYLL